LQPTNDALLHCERNAAVAFVIYVRVANSSPPTRAARAWTRFAR